MPPYEYPSPARSSPGDDKPNFADTPYVNYPPEAMTPQMKRHNERIKQRDEPEQPSANVPMSPVRHVQPITIVHPATVVMPEIRHVVEPKQPENEPKRIPETIRKVPEKEFGNNSPKNSETIPNPNSSNETEPTPQAGITPYKKKGQVGRKRKYEEAGNNGEIPVRDVVLFRHVKGRHWPGMSQDMREWYEFYYFKKPVRTERAKDAEDYTRHCKSWERRERWISEHEASQGRYYQSQAVGNSGKIVAYRKRANG